MSKMTFYESHIKTLSELYAIAEKHGCRIIFGIDTNTNHPDDFEITDFMIERSDNLKILAENNITIYGGVNDEFTMFFELITKEGKYNILRYERHSGYVNFDKDEIEELPTEIKDEFYTEYSDDHDYFDLQKTEVYGFENVEYKPNIYREGIMLREFSIMVCDYLGEPRIVRNY